MADEVNVQPAVESAPADAKVLERLEKKRRRGFGLRGRVVLGIVLVALLFLRLDTFPLTAAKLVASEYVFSLEQWEIAHFHRKWLHRLWEFIPGKKPSREERLAILQEYLDVSLKAQKEKNRLEGLLAPTRRGATLSAGASQEDPALARQYLNELLAERKKLKAAAEEAIEAELSAVLAEQGFEARIGLIFPPVDMWFDPRPTLFVVSPRDRIQLWDAVLLDPEIKGIERDRMEQQMLDRYNLSALVDNLAGISTYPAIVPDTYPLRFILQTAAHEWLHQYFFFRPLGLNLRASADMYTLNETAADMAGRELGDMVFARMGGDLSVSARDYLPDEERDPNFTREMRATRLRAEELLAEGKVEEAEEYLKQRWWFFSLRGYGLRKLNQAYFAFRGNYGESSASVSPISSQLKEFRAFYPSVGEFVKAISRISSYQQFVDTLERLK
jgi:hypothetical protein